MKHYLYILKSEKDGRFYTGITKDLKRRLEEHNRNKSKYYKNRGPYKLVYFEEHESSSDARKREMYLKSPSGGINKKELVENFNNGLLRDFDMYSVEHP